MSQAPSAASHLPELDLQPIRRALVSVSDKVGVVALGRALAARGVELLSTGGTFKALADAGVPVVQVSDYTASPEIMGGRVKTLHPRIHGGILMRGDVDLDDLAKVGGKPIDLVVVNLYPFESTVVRAAQGAATHAQVIEEIDIGGPSMVRSAAKSHPRVTVLVDPTDYVAVLEELENKGGTTLATRARLAAKAFAHTAAYDGAIASYLSKQADGYSQYLTLAYEKVYALRYGENPHQTGAFYRARGAAEGTLARAESLGSGGKELSFNNFVDVQAAHDAVRDLDRARPGCVVVKHTNPCGVATADSLEIAYR
ncbi:MAG: bifunctional phosphoribosylaminoimidazolecarboxamide formyltransferase/IMP cyclohydrolase, partial [Polyangiales bacterium]